MATEVSMLTSQLTATLNLKRWKSNHKQNQHFSGAPSRVGYYDPYLQNDLSDLADNQIS